MKTGHYHMRSVVGTGRVEGLVEGCVGFAEPAVEILEWRKAVIVHRADAIDHGVILTGSLRSCSLYSRPDPGARPVTDGGVFGSVRFHAAEIAFTQYIPVPGAAPGMDVRVTEAFVQADVSIPISDVRPDVISGVLDRSVIRLAVRVVQPEPVTIHKGSTARQPAPAPRKRTAQKRRKKVRPARVASVPAVEPVPEPPSPVWVDPSARVPVQHRPQ